MLDSPKSRLHVDIYIIAMISVYHHLILKTNNAAKRDIRAIMLYEFKRGNNAAKTTQQINETFGENVVSYSTVQRWFKKSREGSEDFENKKREKPESILENDVLREIVEIIPSTTVSELTRELNVSKSTVSRHLQEIEKTKKLNRWIPHN
uniref:Histone-lysine N-methyltransferase SETMAR (inferred by orthology to a human protein) n=1 Tax=Strongyloides venezuelensis TaxID=75913 RepID=A0A0K0G4S5_STRVS